ncbi:MAG: hypothetical protein WCT03_02935 [Candidatus Obscuribacterales bacterium]|jgi:hypothetical protein
MLTQNLFAWLKASIVLTWFAIGCLVFGASSGYTACHDDDEKAFLERSQSEICHNFFPPKGWCFSDGTVEGILMASGDVRQLKVVKHLTNYEDGRKSKQADDSLLLAIKHSLPLNNPPASLAYPAQLRIKFLTLNKIHGGYKCLAEIVSPLSVTQVVSGASF